MSGPEKPVKVVLTASICLIASSGLQGKATAALIEPEPQLNAMQKSIEAGSAVETAEGKLYRALFALSPAEKLKIGGDRVRLSRANTESNQLRGKKLPIRPTPPKIPPTNTNATKPQPPKKSQ